jgi:hypothetical protein
VSRLEVTPWGSALVISVRGAAAVAARFHGGGLPQERQLNEESRPARFRLNARRRPP